MKRINLNTILTIILIGIVLWLSFKPVKIIERTTETETRIEATQDIINNYKEQVIVSAANNEILEEQIDHLTELLNSAKLQKDTVQIIRLQDTTIYVLKQSNDTLKKIISIQDSMMSKCEEINTAKDTIIEILKSDTKKFKNQKNLAIGVAVVAIIAKPIINLIK